jgi:monofunctional biosynthetic peptidoglycan transglycosylase
MSDSRENKLNSGQPRERKVRPDTQPLRDEELPRVKAGGGSGQSAGAHRQKRSFSGERREPLIRELPEPVSRPRKAAANKHPRKARKEERGALGQNEKRHAGSALAIKRRRRWPWVLLGIVVVLFLVTWVPVLVTRWADPPTTAYMLETAVGTHDGPIKHTWVSYDAIAPVMRLAVVASEDQTFPYNHGFDVHAIQQAMRHNKRASTRRGASTITQQTARNLFLWPGGGYFRKGVEAWFTVLIDLDWPKWRVLEVYLNVAQFGPTTFGAEAAAEHYFGKHASQLTAPEAALLAATLPDPQHFDPAHPSTYLIQRQQWILAQMKHLGLHSLDSL